MLVAARVHRLALVIACGAFAFFGLVFGSVDAVAGVLPQTAARVGAPQSLAARPLVDPPAGAPEAPVTEAASEVSDSSAVVNGVVDPGKAESVSWFFAYAAGSSCEGGSVTGVEGPEEAQGRGVSARIEGLSPDTEYAVCLVAENGSGASEGNIVQFITAPEAPETLSPAKDITAKSASFEGVLNPSSVETDGWYFAYNEASSGSCMGASTTPLEAEAAVEGEVVTAAVGGLAPSRKYLFCLVATDDGGGQSTVGNEVAFETAGLGPEVIAGSESATAITDDEASLNATIEPNDQETSYAFEYSLKATGETLEGSIETAPGESPIPAGEYGEHGVSVSTGAVLHADETYYYRVSAENAKGEAATGTVEHFQTSPEAPEGEEATPVGTTTTTLKGVLAPNASMSEEAGTYEFLYKQSPSECEGASEAPSPAATAAGAEKEAVSVELSELSPGTHYTFCLQEQNSSGVTATASPISFETLGAGIAEEQVTSVEAEAATLQAEIEPNGQATTYHFEYDTSPYTSEATHGIDTVEEELSAGSSPVLVSARIKGLTPGATYYYRIVATNETGTFDGESRSVTTPAAPKAEATGSCPNEALRAEQPFGLTLPECRAYEMVSPTETFGQDATDSFVGSGARAAVSGEAVTYSSKGSFGEASGTGIENQYVSRRGSDGWSTQDVTLLEHPVRTEGFSPYGSMVFTPELTAGVSTTNAALVSGAPEGEGRGLYLSDFASGAYQYLGAGYRPAGASTNLSHVVFGETGEVFEWIEGTVIPVSVSNSGVNIAASVGSAPDQAGGESGTAEHDVWHAVSANGSRVYFTSPNAEVAGGIRQLYLRVNAEAPQSTMSGEDCTEAEKACTIEVSASQRSTPDPHGPQDARFWGASADGAKVFFTSDAELTNDAYTGPDDNAADLYEYELSGEPDVPGTLTDLSVDTSGNGAAVQGVVQISEDGQYVYFVADGALAAGATAGEPNLYVSHEGAAPRFIGTLAARDYSDWNYGEPDASGPEDTTAVVDPAGSALAFTSERSLTGYDNEQAAPGDCEGTIDNNAQDLETGKCREIYLYDAVSGSLMCASCDPTSARPMGPSTLPLVHDTNLVYRPRTLLESGALFFDSFDALVPHAGDGRQNVYEYREGRIRAISDVGGRGESFFLDASANGDDVFFGSADKLLTQDAGDNVVVWDARVDGGFPSTAAPTPCDNADSCKPPVSPQPASLGPPASATFSGPGNASPVPSEMKTKVTKTSNGAKKLKKALLLCKKDGSSKKRANCEARARRTYGPKRAKPKKKAGERTKKKHADDQGRGK